MWNMTRSSTYLPTYLPTYVAGAAIWTHDLSHKSLLPDPLRAASIIHQNKKCWVADTSITDDHRNRKIEGKITFPFILLNRIKSIKSKVEPVSA